MLGNQFRMERFVLAGKEAWITFAEDDGEARKAIRLAKSLRKTLTARKVLVIIGPEISHEMTECLTEEFDVVLPLNVKNLMADGNNDFEGAVKIALHGTRMYKAGIVLSPSIVVSYYLYIMSYEGNNC